MKSQQKKKLIQALSLILGSQTVGVLAQVPKALEEVIVTAQKRSQSIQNVGIAINAFTGNTLENLGVTNSNEIAAKTPNLTIVSPSGEGGVVSAFIRGIGLNDFALNNTGPVGYYVDGSSIGSTNSQLTTLLDIERIEVLKGPQGTLFGRNTTGGAINIISKKPSNEREGALKLSAGNYGTKRAEGMLSGAINQDINARIAFVSSETDGYIQNLSNNDFVGKENFSGRALFDIKLNDTGALLLNLHASTLEGDADLYGTSNDADFFSNAHGNRPFIIDTKTKGASLESNFDLNDDLVLTSISSYDEFEKIQDEDADLTPLNLIQLQYNTDLETISQELRLNGQTDKTDWVLGLYYLNEQNTWLVNQDLSDLPLIPGVVNFGLALTKGDQDLTTQALFGQIEYQFTDKLNLTIGARYTDLNIDFDFSPSLPNFAFVGLPASLDFSSRLNNKEVSGKIALDYQAKDNILYYGSLTQGFKGGGFNGGLVSDLANYPTRAEYKPETLTAFELGLKSALFDGSMQLNMAAFIYDYQDAQVFNGTADPVFGLPQNVVENADSLKLYGLDIDLTWQASTALFIQAGLGYTHSEFDEYQFSVPAGGGTLSFANISGETPQNTPEINANILATYTLNLEQNGSLSAQIDGSYQSEIFFSNGKVLTPGDPQSYDRNKALSQSGYSLWNARLSWRNTAESLELSIWGKNLADKQYRAYMFDLKDLIGANQIMRGVPRTYGIDAKYSF